MENGYSYSSYSGYSGYGKDRADGRERGFSVWVLTFIALAAMEALFRVFTAGFGETAYLVLDILISLLACASLASLLYFLRSLPRLIGRIAYTILMSLLIVLFLSQAVYYRIFATYYTFYSFLNGAQVTEFMGTIWDAIWSVKFQLLALLAVGAAAITLTWRRGQRPRSPRRLRLAVAGLLCLLFLGLFLLISSAENDDPLRLISPSTAVARSNRPSEAPDSWERWASMSGSWRRALSPTSVSFKTRWWKSRLSPTTMSSAVLTL